MDVEQLRAIKDKRNASKNDHHENDGIHGNNKRSKKAADKGNKSAMKSTAAAAAASDNPENADSSKNQNEDSA